MPRSHLACAMVTPFTRDGDLDLPGTQHLAAALVDEGGCDGLVLGGTTGESPTTTDAEKTAVIEAVTEAVGDRARIVAGVGSNDTTHAVALARAAEKAGAHGLLVVTPYYSRPPQEAVEAHFRMVADAVGIPVTLYDIPFRTGVALSYDTLCRLAEHPRVTGVKDCAYDLMKSARTMAATGLAYYSGCDELNLPLRAIGAVGCISTVANVAPREVRGVLEAYDAGDPEEAARRHLALTPLIDAMMSHLPGAVTAKALLSTLGRPGGTVRPPLFGADATVTADLAATYATAT
ncbi:4-hydroxy-tetrahydrodipicolinate synthase [Streptomyces botrytidirepellens]|nr:4-hydroxy-tetrahydrodipicolinate synthase [Streptomyces botrytidirepellens]